MKRLVSVPVAWLAAVPIAWWALLAAMAVGIGVRAYFAFAVFNDWNFEMENVARALAAGRGWADTFRVGGGPTAHVMPLAPLVGAASYHMFGNAVPGLIMRFAWAMLITFSAYLLTARAMIAAGAPRVAVFTGAALISMVPIRLHTESVYWQLWDGGLATVFAMGAMLMLLRAEASGASPRNAVVAAMLAAVSFVVNPLVGAAAMAMLAVHLLRMREMGRIVRAGLSATLVLAVVLVPWTIRNHAVMGAPVVLRDNAGLELAVAYYPEAVSFKGNDQNLWARLVELHPGHPKGWDALVAAGGEVAYSRKLAAETTSWMRAHPQSVMLIMARHLRETVFTPEWIFHSEGQSGRSPWLAMAYPFFVMLAALALAMAAVRRDRRYLYPAMFMGLVILLGMPFQTTDRYSWPLFPIMMLLAADGAWRLIGLLRLGWDRMRAASRDRSARALSCEDDFEQPYTEHAR